MHFLFFFLRSSCRQQVICFGKRKTCLSFSTATSHFMVDYLIQRCGLSRERANSASKTLIHVKSPENPDSVLRFLKQRGFDDTHIRLVISKHPRLLTARVDKTLEPKFIFFQELGLYGAPFAELTTRLPYFLLYSLENRLQPSIDFLRTFLRTNHNVVSAIKKWTKLLTCDHQKRLLPSIKVLRESGLPDHQISYLLLSDPNFITLGPRWLQRQISRAERIGVERGSGMLLYALLAMGKLNETTVEAKLKLFKSFGWSEEDISCAFRRHPLFMAVAESKIRAVLSVLMNELGYKPSEIALKPRALAFSLEKRLLPRHEVLKILKSRGFLKEGLHLLIAVYMTNDYFLQIYVLEYLDRAPHLREAYMLPLGITENLKRKKEREREFIAE